MVNISIFGAGVSGLTLSHELSKNPLYKINIYEARDKIGGMARSLRDSDGCNQEISWRVFFGFYHNVFRIMSEIPLINNPQNTTLNNLTPYKHLNITDNPMTFNEKMELANVIIYGITSCDERLQSLDNLAWKDAISSTSQTNLLRQTATWLGLNRNSASYNSVIKVGIEMQMINAYTNKNYIDYVTTKPTSEAWFDHWENKLIKDEVNFHFNSELTSVEISNNSITSVYVNNNTKIVSDYYIFSLPVEVLAKLIIQTPELNHDELSKVPMLSNLCYQVQIAFQIYFDRKILLGNNNAFLIVDSAWDLIVLMYDQIYTDTQLCIDIPNVKSGWSVTVCSTYQKGIIYDKSLIECTYDEILTEIWAQIMNSKNLRQIVVNNNGFELSSEMIIKWSPLWPTFKYDKKIVTTEPKFSNNTGSLMLRPSVKTHINNLYLSTAYVKETIDIFSMEAAAIAGLHVANLISNSSKKPFILSRPMLFYPARKIDELCYYLNLPNLSILIIIIILVLFIFLICKKSRK